MEDAIDSTLGGWCWLESWSSQQVRMWRRGGAAAGHLLVYEVGGTHGGDGDHRGGVAGVNLNLRRRGGEEGGGGRECFSVDRLWKGGSGGQGAKSLLG